MKKCTICLEDKPLEDFHLTRVGIDKRRPHCKVCGNKAASLYGNSHPRKVNPVAVAKGLAVRRGVRRTHSGRQKYMYEQIGYKVVLASVINRIGVDEVNELLHNKTTLLSGHSGVGKSTFIKAIVNEFEYKGNIKMGHNVQVGYFAQNQAEYLDGEITLLRTMEDAATDTNRDDRPDWLFAHATVQLRAQLPLIAKLASSSTQTTTNSSSSSSLSSLSSTTESCSLFVSQWIALVVSACK